MENSVLYTILVTLLTLGILVSVHEAGHFFVARWCSVKVLRFSVGFGKPLWRHVGANGTEYVLAVVPLGGYVRMLDSRNDTVDSLTRQQAFNHQSVYKRIAIVAAGPLINLLFAGLLYAVVHYAGVTQLVPITGAITTSSQAYEAGLREGMRITAIDGVSTSSWQQVNMQLLKRIGESGSLLITAQAVDTQDLQRQAQRDMHADEPLSTRLIYLSPQQEYRINLHDWLADSTDAPALQRLGLTMWQPRVPVRLGQIVDGGAAQLAGLQVGDLITHFNHEPIPDYGDFVKRVKNAPEQVVQVSLWRHQQVFDVSLRLHSKTLPDGQLIGLIGVGVAGATWPPALLIKPDLRTA